MNTNEYRIRTLTMPVEDKPAYIQTRIIFVANCEVCPYRRGDALVPICRGVRRSIAGVNLGKPRELPNFFPKIPDWCPGQTNSVKCPVAGCGWDAEIKLEGWTGR